MSFLARHILITVFILLSTGLFEISFGQQAEEYALKASYVQRFMNFVNWPDQNDEKSSRPFVIGVIGENPFNNSLDDVFSKFKPDDREVKINYITDKDEKTNCDLLFIANSEKDNLSQILEEVSDKAILTIGDTNDFGSAGVIINFYVEGTILHFEINLKAAKKTGLEIDPFLLDYATIIDSTEVSDDRP